MNIHVSYTDVRDTQAADSGTGKPATPCNLSESPPPKVMVNPSFGGLNLPSYRLYRLDGAGKIISAEWVEAADDEAAERHGRERNLPGTCEIWDRNRLVARIEPRRG